MKPAPCVQSNLKQSSVAEEYKGMWKGASFSEVQEGS